MKQSYKNLEKETKISFSTSTGPGGQRRDRKKTGVILHHLPSDIIVRADNLASQSQNRKAAFNILGEKLKKINQRKKKRIPTRTPKRAKEKRLKEKKERAGKKQLRRKLFNL
ncbi:MAG: peptide chain release factor-like protein [bacterium]